MKPSERAQRLIAELVQSTRDALEAKGKDVGPASNRLRVVKQALSDFIAEIEHCADAVDASRNLTDAEIPPDEHTRSL